MKSYNHSKRRERSTWNNSQEKSNPVYTSRRQPPYNPVSNARYGSSQDYRRLNTNINVVSQADIQWSSERRYDDFLQEKQCLRGNHSTYLQNCNPQNIRMWNFRKLEPPPYSIYKVSFTVDVEHKKYEKCTISVHVVARNSTQARSLVFRDERTLNMRIPFKSIKAVYEPVDAIITQMKPDKPLIIEWTERKYFF